MKTHKAQPILLRERVARRVSDAEDPRVLRRALELAVAYMSGTNKAEQMEVVYEFMDDARRELESEGNDDQAR